MRSGNPYVWAALVVLPVLALYLPALSMYLRGDDFPWLSLAYPLRHSLHGLIEKDFVFFRPTVRLSYFVNYALFRHQIVAYNGINIALHILNTVLLYVHVFRLSGRVRLAAVTALLFGTSSFYSEVPTWAAARPDLHVTACMLGILVLFSKQSPFGGTRDWSLFGLFLIGAFGSKENWMILPFLLLGLLWMYKRYPLKRAFRVTTPAWILLFVYLTIFFLLPSLGSSSASPLSYSQPLHWETVQNAMIKGGYLVYKYVGLGDVFYGEAWQILLAGLGGVAVGLLAIRLHCRLALWGGLWMLLAMMPTLHIYYAPSRFNYLPLMGFWIMVVASVDAVLAMLRRTWRVPQRYIALGCALCVGCLVAYHGIMVQWEIHDYRIFGNWHKKLVEAYREIVDEVPADEPILLVNASRKNAVVEFEKAIRGHIKMQYSKPGGLWEIIYFDDLADYVGDPFHFRMERIDAPLPENLLDQPFTVIVFTDDGFRMTQAYNAEFRAFFRAHQILPDAVEAYVLRTL